MKVFGCKVQQGYGGGLILVAANTKEEAFLTAAMDSDVMYRFDWHDEEGWIECDGNINHVTSYNYPLRVWFEVEHLYTDLTEPQVIIEDSYIE